MQKEPFIGRCHYCGERGHFMSNCKKWMRDEKVFKESQEGKIEE